MPVQQWQNLAHPFKAPRKSDGIKTKSDPVKRAENGFAAHRICYISK